MILGIYSIKDALTGFMNCTLEQNDACAIRNFEHAVTRVDSLFFSHPEHYALYRIGKFDTTVGIVDISDAVPIASASDILVKKGDE